MERNYGIDCLKFIASVAVVVQHVNGQFIGYENNSTIFGQNILSFSFTFAVPLFFIISGFFYYKTKYQEKHIQKNLMILAVCFGVYTIINFIGINILDLRYNLMTISILWYLRVLIFLQLLFLLRDTIYIYIILIISLLFRFGIIFDYSLGNGNNLIASVPFFVSGMLIRKYYNGLKNNRLGIILLVLGAVGIVNNANLQFTKMSLYMLLCATLLFIGVLLISNKYFEFKDIYKYSLWVYVAQMLFLPSIRNIQIFQKIYTYFGNYVFLYEVFLIILIMSALIILREIIRKIKIINTPLEEYGI